MKCQNANNYFFYTLTISSLFFSIMAYANIEKTVIANYDLNTEKSAHYQLILSPQQQEKARQLIDGMARFPQAESAIKASESLGGVLDHANHNYQVLAQAVNGQARLSSQTVRSLLS